MNEQPKQTSSSPAQKRRKAQPGSRAERRQPPQREQPAQAEGVRTIVDEAAQAVDAIREQAATLAQSAEALRRDADMLAGKIADAGRRLDGPAASEPPAKDEEMPSAGARLLATQLAAGGSSRGEIETKLRDEFGVDDAAGMLDGIAGREEG